MGFDALIRKGVAIADRATASIQAKVTVEAYTGVDDNSQPQYGTGVVVDGIVEDVSIVIKRAGGEDAVAVAKMLVPRSLAINVLDRVTMPDGRITYVIATKGPTDPKTSKPYLRDVWLSLDRYGLTE